MTALAKTPTHVVGEQTELARYTLPTGAVRIIAGQRIDGEVILIDHPADEQGCVYLIERGLERDGNAAMRALINDYLHVSDQIGEIPAASCGLDRYLDHLDDQA